jgi:tetratricopeptide (TPR) repeat protein
VLEFQPSNLKKDTTLIPDVLVKDIRSGRIVLLLGAGASAGAKDDAGKGPPNANELRDLICDRFLGGSFKESALSWVADLAISETDLPTVQDFIAEILMGIKPADFHFSLPTFKWRAIATTNYDLIVERAYSIPQKSQTLVPHISNKDRIDEKLRSPESLPFIKLHGCITRTHDLELPLILTPDQYVTHKSGRNYLFNAVESWAIEYPMVIVGSSGQDADLRALLLEVSKDLQMRPRFYMLKPGTTEVEARFWETKKITTIPATFEQFLSALEAIIPKEIRPILTLVRNDHPIQRRFGVNEEISQSLAECLSNDFEYVHESIPTGGGNAEAFYKGFDLGWYPIVGGLDVSRRLGDQILNDIIIRSEDDRPSQTELYVIKAEAGAGKSVLLRRIAWDSALHADCLCLFLREFGNLSVEGIKEISRLTKQRIFLFIDNASEKINAIVAAMTAANREHIPLTLLTAERSNVWNITCERLTPFVTDTFDLRYLSRKEIENLVDLLSKSNSLGPNLTGKSKSECVTQFEERAGRQLLVALHEATMGLPFEQILVDEYTDIVPLAAQRLYLTICVLNRFGISVRAGIIARIYGIKYEDFEKDFFRPLEHVVKVEKHPGTQDFHYLTRHPEIAQIVFDRILRDPRDRFSEYLNLISSLNLSYSTDRTAFRGLLRAKALHELFPDYQDVSALFDKAFQIGPTEAYVYQQRANYERIRPNGNLIEAERLLQKAKDFDPRDPTIIHTLAEVKRARADAAKQGLEREKFRKEARSILRPLLDDAYNDRYSRSTMVKLAIDEFQDILHEPRSTEKDIDRAIRNVETILHRSLQQYPDDTFLLSAEADYSRVLKDHGRSFSALKRAFEANRRDTYIASRLAQLYEEMDEFGEAKQILHDALQANRGDQVLNYRYANMLRFDGDQDCPRLVYHYRRAFTKWDRNYDAHFWLARFLFESNNAEERRESKDIFKRLRNSPIHFEARNKIRDIALVDDRPQKFFGTIAQREYAHGFINRDGLGDWIFIHRSETNETVWNSIRPGVRVSFYIGFTLNGPIALNIGLAL